MPGDAKLGLILGVGLVVTAALVYYRPDGAHVRSSEAASVKAAPTGGLYRTVQLSPPIDHTLDEN